MNIPLVNCDEYVLRKFEYYGANKELIQVFTKQAKKLQYEELFKIIQESRRRRIHQKSSYSGKLCRLFGRGELRIKGIFNGIFGQEYQAPIHDDMAYSVMTGTASQQYHNRIMMIVSPKTKIHYCTGHIAAWTRFELACMIWYA